MNSSLEQHQEDAQQDLNLEISGHQEDAQQHQEGAQHQEDEQHQEDAQQHQEDEQQSDPAFQDCYGIISFEENKKVEKTTQKRRRNYMLLYLNYFQPP